MSQKDARLPVSHKNLAPVKKISKEVDDSGSVAVRPRGAPTLTAVPVRRAWIAGPATTHPQHAYDFTPRAPYIQIYSKFQNNPFKSKIRDPKF